MNTLPTDAQERKGVPVVTGVLDYFPAAIAEIAKVSMQGNIQHNPGEALHWARNKSTDQADTIVRHLMERGTVDIDGMRHSAKMAWRALALLQLELEAEGAPLARGASYDSRPIISTNGANSNRVYSSSGQGTLNGGSAGEGSAQQLPQDTKGMV